MGRQKLKLSIMCCFHWYRKHLLSGADDSIPVFDLNKYKGYAKITSVYDGDTFKACIFKHGRILKFTFRTAGYDAPEMKPNSKLKDREMHVRMAKMARQDFKHLCGFDDTKVHKWWNPFKCQLKTNGWVWIECGPNDKYGRTLVTVYRRKADEKSINEKMIDIGANAYSGGKKTEFTFV